MNDFFEENKNLVIAILALVIIAIIFILIKSIFFYSPPKGEKTIFQPAEKTGIENLKY